MKNKNNNLSKISDFFKIAYGNIIKEKYYFDKN